MPIPRHRELPAALPIVETSHLLGSLGGVLLLLIGQGLQRRSHSAWLLAFGLCLVLPLPVWLRGGHLLVALTVPLAAIALWTARREFYREGVALAFLRHDRQRLTIEFFVRGGGKAALVVVGVVAGVVPAGREPLPKTSHTTSAITARNSTEKGRPNRKRTRVAPAVPAVAVSPR